ncbi:MAG: hypothetical protein NT105_23295 [Verrucomicrobia bacterium]|nr:hypothetical protein [Verrucomicrobiota bacterium]
MSIEGLTPEKHREQIEAYTRQHPDYVIYAKALERVLKAACAVSLPEAFVQARPKSIASFAEKAARRFATYPDAVNQLTDLCGGRVIVQTLEQVEAVCAFVEKNFRVLERDDKTTHLKADQFGYRDMHFIIQVPADCPLGFTPEERRVIGERRAELQVRTWVQHAWADTLHDRMYKTPLRLSAEIKRTGNLLAAVMEEGDRGFNRLAHELDGMLANYTAYASRENVEKEIAVQRLLLTNADDSSRPAIALKLARLIATKGEWAEVVSLLEPCANAAAPLGLALRSELGHALCRQHRAKHDGAAYRRGQEFLQQVIAAFEQKDFSAMPNLRRDRSVHARALARLGWSYEPIEGEAHEARRYYARAVELEPGNPYYLAEMLGFELHYAQESGMLASFRSTIRSTLRTCQEHEASGTELPAAHFTAGRLLLLLGEPLPSLQAYARGVRYCLYDEGISPCDVLSNEVAWLHRINPGRALPEQHRWAKELLDLAMSLRNCDSGQVAARKPAALTPPVLIVAGGAASLPAAELPHIQELLLDALGDFPGTILSGGTTSGVPGCVGAVAARLDGAGRKRFHLRGYIPRSLPENAEKDKRYDRIVASGAEHFSPEQILHGWKDVLASGIRPADVLLLGFGGGSLAAFEYRVALTFGATVGVVMGSGGEADALLKDALWSSLPRLLPLPADAKTLRAFVLPDGSQFDPGVLETMAQEFHTRYRNANLKKIQPDNVKRWEHLPDTYKQANLEQAAYAIRILEAAGFDVRKPDGHPPVIFTGFTNAEVELMAQLEHGRWVIERLRAGWRPGPRDDEKKLHNCLVAWSDKEVLTEEIKNFDRVAVCSFPEILAKAGLQVTRKQMS